jgi:RimJ/RimL family protein N-acetyltransferase
MARANDFPTLATRRLRLVVPEARHYEDFLALHTDPGTMRWVGQGMPLDRVEAWLHLAMLIGHWQMRGYGVWMVEDLHGRFIGRVGLFHPDGWDEPELNWMITPVMRGQGLAAEAARAAIEHAFGTLGLPSLISLIRPGNESSRKVAIKLGAVEADTVAFLGGPVQIFRYRPPA